MSTEPACLEWLLTLVSIRRGCLGISLSRVEGLDVAFSWEWRDMRCLDMAHHRTLGTDGAFITAASRVSIFFFHYALPPSSSIQVYTTHPSHYIGPSMDPTSTSQLL